MSNRANRAEFHHVAITAIDLASACGPSLDDLRDAVWSGRDTRSEIPAGRMLGSADDYQTTKACCIEPRFHEPGTGWSSQDLVDLGVERTRRALGNCAPVDLDDTALVLATTTGGSFSYVDYKRAQLAGLPGIEHLRQPMSSSVIAGEIACSLGLGAPVSVVSTACAAGSDGIGRAIQMLDGGQARRVVVLGLDLFAPIAYAGFNALRALSPGRARPFDHDRDGLTLGDAVAVLVADAVDDVPDTAVALVEGFASGNEAHHATAPDPTGSTLARVLLGALDDAGLDANDLDYLNAHGTATPANDSAELAAIATVCEFRTAPLPVSSTKHITGHCLGAAGVVEAAVCCLAIDEGIVPGNHATTSPEPHSDVIELPNVTYSATVDHAASTNLAFSGNVAAVVFGSTRQGAHNARPDHRTDR